MKARCGDRRQGPVLRPGPPAVSRGREGPGAWWQVSEKAAWARGPRQTPAGFTEGKPRPGRGPAATLPGPRGRDGDRPPLSLAPDRPVDAAPQVSEASGHPGPCPGRLGPSGRARPPWPPAGTQGAGGPALIVSMGDDFQGEISSSVESLSFKAARQMSSPPGPRAGAAPAAFKFTPLSLSDTCLNQYLPLQVAGRMCPALHTALLKSTKINTIIEIFSS